MLASETAKWRPVVRSPGLSSTKADDLGVASASTPSGSSRWARRPARADCARSAGITMRCLPQMSDGPRLAADRPTIFLGSRGCASIDLWIDAREGGHHSGNWGGLLSSPAIRLPVPDMAGPLNPVSEVLDRTPSCSPKRYLDTFLSIDSSPGLRPIPRDLRSSAAAETSTPAQRPQSAAART